MSADLIPTAKPPMPPDRADFELLNQAHSQPDGLFMIPMGALVPDEMQQAFVRANLKEWIRFFDVLELTVPPQNETVLRRVFMITLDGIARLNSLKRSH